MIYLKEKEEITTAMREYPILMVKKNDRGVTGCKVRVEYNSRSHGTMVLKGQLSLSDGKVAVTNMSGMVTAGISYSDVIEMAEFANAPILKKGKKAVLVIDDMENFQCSVVIMQVGTVDPNGITCTTLK